MKQSSLAARSLDPRASAAVTPAVTGAELGSLTAADEVTPSLPREHPVWQRDCCSISARTRAVLASLRPVVVRVLTFWDHAIRSIPVRGRRLDVDPSGCYRLC